MYGRMVLCILFLVLLPAGQGEADVLGSSASGFLVKNEANVGAPADSVYHALVGRVANWWDPAHTYSGDSRNLSLDPTLGGCFCEALPNGGGIRHLEVVYVSPGKTLRLMGALGPFQESGMTGSMTWNCEAVGDSTKLEMTYSVGGYFQGDLQKMAPVFDTVLREQLWRLKTYVEIGKPKPE
jgi:hypothetical protein